MLTIRNNQRLAIWRWSRSRGIWEEGDCPADEILQAVFMAVR
jgi:hypothetical protein